MPGASTEPGGETAEHREGSFDEEAYRVAIDRADEEIEEMLGVLVAQLEEDDRSEVPQFPRFNENMRRLRGRTSRDRSGG